MRTTLNVCTIKNENDVNVIREAIANHEGVIACEVNDINNEVVVVYDDKSVSLEEVITSIEMTGHSIAQ